MREIRNSLEGSFAVDFHGFWFVIRRKHTRAHVGLLEKSPKPASNNGMHDRLLD